MRYPLTASQILSLDTKLIYDFFFKDPKPLNESTEASDMQSEQTEITIDKAVDPQANLFALFSFLDQETVNYTSAGRHG